jgi:DUF1680 family protein
MTDVAALLDDGAFRSAVGTLWTDVVSRRMYLTGGLGSEGRTEAFGDDYALSNQAYAETCASVGGLLWYHRMFLREGDGAYYDTFERTLYNGYLSGVSLKGDTFFYQNPLVSDGSRERSPYFDVACCPANLARLMAQLPGLIYAQRDHDLYLSLFVGSEANLTMDGTAVRVSQHTNYPWEGRVTIAVDPERPIEATVNVRIPSWSQGQTMPAGDLYRFAAGRGGAGPVLSLNGRSVPLRIDRGYAAIHRRWQKGDVVQLELPMPIQRVLAHEAVADDRGKAAIERGPIVYCVEGVDNRGRVALSLPLDAALRHHFDSHLLGGVEVVTGGGVVAVPYFAWNNRGAGEMAVWIPYR